MYKFIALYIALLSLFFIACEPDKPVPPAVEKMEIATAAATKLGLNLSLLADDTLRAAYTPLYLSVTGADGKAVSGLEITVTPIMHMPSMVHSAPVEQPVATLDADKLYAFAAVFIMPGDAMSYWELKVNIKNPTTDASEEIIFPIEVIAPLEARVRNLYAADDSSRLFIALVAPTAPKVGINDFVLTVHRRASMMSFPELAGLDIEIEPEMPSMGHGSPNNVNPGYTQAGHYAGKVNFTMDGWWRVHVRLRRNGQLIGETDFSITFQAK